MHNNLNRKFIDRRFYVLLSADSFVFLFYFSLNEENMYRNEVKNVCVVHVCMYAVFFLNGERDPAHPIQLSLGWKSSYVYAACLSVCSIAGSVYEARLF